MSEGGFTFDLPPTGRILTFVQVYVEGLEHALTFKEVTQ